MAALMRDPELHPARRSAESISLSQLQADARQVRESLSRGEITELEANARIAALRSKYRTFFQRVFEM